MPRDRLALAVLRAALSPDLNASSLVFSSPRTSAVIHGYCCCCLPCTQCSSLYNVYSIGVPSCFVLTAVNTVISVQPSHNAVVFASALFFSAAYVITDQICKFRIPGL